MKTGRFWPLQRVLCVFGRHYRDGNRVHFDGDLFRGRCLGCGVKLVREDGGWQVDPNP